MRKILTFECKTCKKKKQVEKKIFLAVSDKAFYQVLNGFIEISYNISAQNLIKPNSDSVKKNHFKRSGSCWNSKIGTTRILVFVIVV